MKTLSQHINESFASHIDTREKNELRVFIDASMIQVGNIFQYSSNKPKGFTWNTKGHRLLVVRVLNKFNSEAEVISYNVKDYKINLNRSTITDESKELILSNDKVNLNKLYISTSELDNLRNSELKEYFYNISKSMGIKIK